ncbi:hypothetical protein LshimejAT787_0307090 [Lyophyllum shimeji]|uniref:Uncharacterized protein n=1 Tax=Lyophyllum shimeji TaxID=47721 RepID=A0A9P3PJ97_LYOSH|nr:hypothetical protein LshimejAT787_0307090 [Lyophyllum shimeji]
MKVEDEALKTTTTTARQLETRRHKVVTRTLTPTTRATRSTVMAAESFEQQKQEYSRQLAAHTLRQWKAFQRTQSPSRERKLRFTARKMSHDDAVKRDVPRARSADKNDRKAAEGSGGNDSGKLDSTECPPHPIRVM